MSIAGEFSDILVTGGAGFVGSHLALKLKQSFPAARVTSLDNLQRWGSQLNLPRLKQGGVGFRHGDMRCLDDLLAVEAVDLIVDCAAEPSVHAGNRTGPLSLIQTNLQGTLHCLELARQRAASVVFLSTSRVYPISSLNGLPFQELDTRFAWQADRLDVPGFSAAGIGEGFDLTGSRSFYGASKLASELLVAEYQATYQVPAIINRCGVLCGPWQMGKVDQGVVMMWVAHHLLGRPLSYHGFGGNGKQVRDLLHIDDLFLLLLQQLNDSSAWEGGVWQVGGGAENAVSLQELTGICRDVSERVVEVGSRLQTSPQDLRIFIADSNRVSEKFNWKPQHSPRQIVEEIYRWAADHRELVQTILDGSTLAR